MRGSLSKTDQRKDLSSLFPLWERGIRVKEKKGKGNLALRQSFWIQLFGLGLPVSLLSFIRVHLQHALELLQLSSSSLICLWRQQSLSSSSPPPIYHPLLGQVSLIKLPTEAEQVIQVCLIGVEQAQKSLLLSSPSKWLYAPSHPVSYFWQ